MESFQHSHHQPRKKNSAKVNVTISLIIHGLIFAAGAYWAAHEGVLGKKLQALSVLMVPKEKKPDEAKKPEPAKTETVKKADEVKPVETAKIIAPPPRFVPPPAAVEAAAAPPAVIEGFTFDKETITDSIGFYKQQVESALRSRWERPEGLKDNDFTAEVEMRIDAKGQISGYDWKKGSGNQRWDDSVKKALAGGINRTAPKGFPDKFLVRFDVQPSTEPLLSRAD
jgi:hypothetical protein